MSCAFRQHISNGVVKASHPLRRSKIKFQCFGLMARAVFGFFGPISEKEYSFEGEDAFVSDSVYCVYVQGRDDV